MSGSSLQIYYSAAYALRSRGPASEISRTRVFVVCERITSYLCGIPHDMREESRARVEILAEIRRNPL